MLDIKYIRQNQKIIKDILIKRKKDPNILEDLIASDNARLAEIGLLEKTRYKKNLLLKTPKPEEQREKALKLKEEEKAGQKRLSVIEQEFLNLLYKIPNLIADDVPVGKDDLENVEVRKWGEIKKFSFKPKDHLELGQFLGIIDVETASKVAGPRFSYLKGIGALLEFALVQHAFNFLTNKDNIKSKPFVPVVPPIMIRPEVYTKMARLDPTQAEERYFMPLDNLYLIGSAEHTLGPMHMDEVIKEEYFPLRYVGFSTSLRREAGSYGKDTRGILRVHQFDKVEIESFTLPEESLKEQDFIVSIQEKLMQSLEIPYRVVMVCTGDMGGPDFRQIDIESWLPSQNTYRETHSADLMTDYQSRRLNTKVKRKDGTTQLVHMNDATVFAIGRTIVAILENNQQEDGSVIIPIPLRPYLDGQEVIRSK
jgi:seryl-tRNA synthetase